jgi:hypothetical protein
VRPVAFTGEDLTIAGLALVLIVAVALLPWFSLTLLGLTFTISATDAPDGWLGVIALAAAVAVFADIGLEHFAPDAPVPALRGDRKGTRFMVSVLAAGAIALKFLLHVHFGWFGFGFYLCVVDVAALVLITHRAHGGTLSFPRRL